MNEKPMFYIGQRVVAQVTAPMDGWRANPNVTQLIDGKSYYVNNPEKYMVNGLIFIEVSGITGSQYWQGDFIPYDEDLQLEKEISNALNENLKIKI